MEKTINAYDKYVRRGDKVTMYLTQDSLRYSTKALYLDGVPRKEKAFRS